MTHLSTLPSTAEQARHALLLLGAPAPAARAATLDAHQRRYGIPAVPRQRDGT